MDLQNLLIFSKGCAFMYLLLASFYFLLAKHDRVHKILGYMLFFWFLMSVKGLFFMIANIELSPRWSDFLFLIEMLAVPICTFFIVELVSTEDTNLKLLLWLSLPFLLVLAVFLLYPHIVIFNIGISVCIIFGIISLIAMIVKISNYQEWLKNRYSDYKYLNMSWLWNILILLTVFFLLWLYSWLTMGIVIDIIYYLSVVVLWMSVTHNVKQQQSCINDLDNDIVEKDLEIEVPILQSACVEFEAPMQYYGFEIKLKELFEDRKLFLNSNLTLIDVAKELNTNRTYLSEYLNNILSTTFYDYINEFRLEYASKLLLNDQNLNLEVVAERAGFNSLSTFRRSFTKYYGCTPHNFRKNNKLFV